MKVSLGVVSTPICAGFEEFRREVVWNLHETSNYPEIANIAKTKRGEVALKLKRQQNYNHALRALRSFCALKL